MVTTVALDDDGHGASTQLVMVTTVAPDGHGHGVSAPLTMVTTVAPTKEGCGGTTRLAGTMLAPDGHAVPPQLVPLWGQCLQFLLLAESQRDRWRMGKGSLEDRWTERAQGQHRDGRQGEVAQGTVTGDGWWWWPGAGGSVAMAVAAGAQLCPEPLFLGSCAGRHGGTPSTPPLCGWSRNGSVGGGRYTTRMGMGKITAAGSMLWGAGGGFGRGDSALKLSPLQMG